MRVIIDCRPLAITYLLAHDPFERFKWDEKIAHPEVVGPHQTIEVGPCEFSAEDQSGGLMDAQTGVVPIILMGEIRYDDRVNFLGFLTSHVTQFSQKLILTKFDAKSSTVEASTISIGKHNCSDSECPYQQ
jgi:hypothetical protein